MLASYEQDARYNVLYDPSEGPEYGLNIPLLNVSNKQQVARQKDGDSVASAARSRIILGVIGGKIAFQFPCQRFGVRGASAGV